VLTRTGSIRYVDRSGKQRRDRGKFNRAATKVNPTMIIGVGLFHSGGTVALGRVSRREDS